MTAGTFLYVWQAVCDRQPDLFGWPEAITVAVGALATTLIIWAIVRYL